jgi:hypothetical protein
MLDKEGMFLAIARCPIHEQFYSIEVCDKNGGRRLTPSKCCGQWEDIKKWKMDKIHFIEMIKHIMEETGIKIKDLRSET